MKPVTYEQAVSEIESFGIMPERAPSLKPMQSALAATGLMENDRIDPDRVIVVAGTNGKGSVCSTLTTLLEAAGQRTGLYTSPHLIQTTERIHVAGRDLTPEQFVQSYAAIRDVALNLKLSHFEVLTLMAAWVFFSGELGAPVDYAVFEVGLGGIWDATNALPHSYCAITALGMDHQNLLGNTLQEIARNKFGIIPSAGLGAKNPVVVHAPLPAETLALAQETAQSTRSEWFEATPFTHETQKGVSESEPRFFLETPWGRTEIKLAGARGAANTTLALRIFESLGFNPATYLQALARVRWPGRMEKISIPGALCPVYLSGDHNPQGIYSLLELLPAYPRRHLHCLVGVGKDKDLDGILGPLSQLSDASLYLTEIPFRARPLTDYGKWLQAAQSSDSNPISALENITRQAKINDLILITGSLYLVGAIRTHFLAY